MNYIRTICDNNYFLVFLNNYFSHNYEDYVFQNYINQIKYFVLNILFTTLFKVLARAAQVTA
jgi:hypothetical protein